MKLTLFVIAFISVFAANSSAQLPNSNMVLLKNLNDHAGAQQYSACWGYRAPSGREYAILGCPTGTSFVDVTDSTNIHEVGFLSGLPSPWREMKVYSHYAYIVSEAVASGLQIVDLQYLPDSIHFVRTFTYTNYTHTHSIQQDGPYLYLNGGNVSVGLTDQGGVTVLDLTTNPELPLKRGSWGTYYVHDCRVRLDTMYACNIYDPPGTISVINAANKDNLTTITSWVNAPNPFPHNIALVGGGRTYALTTDETSTPVGKLKVWNIANLNNVTLAASWQPTNITTAIVHNVEIYGNYAVVAHYTAGIRVVNITNPQAPTEAAWYDTYPSDNNTTYSGCWGVFMFPSGKFIASDRSTGLYVLRSSLPIGIESNGSTVPESYSLSQNFPNPFNPSTTINYDLPKSGNVKLKVFDILGHEVGLLADGFEVAGSHAVTYDASRLASGVYFYRLEADGFTGVNKMVLLK